MSYRFTVEYVKGSSNVIADCLPRMPSTSDAIGNDSPLSVMCVHSLPISIGNIKTSTATDDILSELRALMINGWPRSKENLPEHKRLLVKDIG